MRLNSCAEIAAGATAESAGMSHAHKGKGRLFGGEPAAPGRPAVVTRNKFSLTSLTDLTPCMRERLNRKRVNLIV